MLTAISDVLCTLRCVAVLLFFITKSWQKIGRDKKGMFTAVGDVLCSLRCVAVLFFITKYRQN